MVGEAPRIASGHGEVREAAARREVERVLGMYEWLFAPPGSCRRAGTPTGPRRRSRDAIEDRTRRVVLVAEHRGELLGLCTAYLDLHSVRFGYRVLGRGPGGQPERRSQGVGKELLDAAKDWARERGATHLELDSGDTRADAHRFYEREGAELDARAASPGSCSVDTRVLTSVFDGCDPHVEASGS